MKNMKKLVIVLFSFTAIGVMGAINQNIRPKSSWSYTSEANRILDSYSYYTSRNTEKINGIVVEIESKKPITGALVESDYNLEILSIKNYKNGILDGKKFDYYGDGSISQITEYKNGQRDGEELQFFPSGSPRVISQYKNNLLVGTRYEFDDRGYRVLFSEYVDGKREGSELRFSENILVEEYTYKNGKLDGKMISYFTDGNIKSEGSYKNNLRDSDWVWYYPASEGRRVKKLTESYSNGRLREVKGSYPDGTLERNMVLTNGNGVFEQYYNNGKIKLKGNVKNYSADGTWTSYDLRGVPVGRTNYNQGRFLY